MVSLWICVSLWIANSLIPALCAFLISRSSKRLALRSDFSEARQAFAAAVSLLVMLWIPYHLVGTLSKSWCAELESFLAWKSV